MFSFMKNFFINMGDILKKPGTVVYPNEKIIIPEGSRGVMHLRLDLDSLNVLCNGCGDCERSCPQGCREDSGNRELSAREKDS